RLEGVCLLHGQDMLVHIGRDDAEGDAEHFEELLPARRAGGEDDRFHAGEDTSGYVWACSGRRCSRSRRPLLARRRRTSIWLRCACRTAASSSARRSTSPPVPDTTTSRFSCPTAA